MFATLAMIIEELGLVVPGSHTNRLIYRDSDNMVRWESEYLDKGRIILSKGYICTVSPVLDGPNVKSESSWSYCQILVGAYIGFRPSSSPLLQQVPYWFTSQFVSSCSRLLEVLGSLSTRMEETAEIEFQPARLVTSETFRWNPVTVKGIYKRCGSIWCQGTVVRNWEIGKESLMPFALQLYLEHAQSCKQHGNYTACDSSGYSGLYQIVEISTSSEARSCCPVRQLESVRSTP